MLEQPPISFENLPPRDQHGILLDLYFLIPINTAGEFDKDNYREAFAQMASDKDRRKYSGHKTVLRRNLAGKLKHSATTSTYQERILNMFNVIYDNGRMDPNIKTHSIGVSEELQFRRAVDFGNDSGGPFDVERAKKLEKIAFFGLLNTYSQSIVTLDLMLDANSQRFDVIDELRSNTDRDKSLLTRWAKEYFERHGEKFLEL